MAFGMTTVRAPARRPSEFGNKKCRGGRLAAATEFGKTTAAVAALLRRGRVGEDGGGNDPSIRSADVLLEPALEELGDAVAIFLEHHFVRVAGQAGILELNVIGFDARLIQPLGNARVKHAVVARLA